MKKFRLLFLLLAISLAFVSCEKDEDEQVSGNKYETTYIKMDMGGSVTLTVEFKTKEELENNDLYFIFEFKSNGDFYIDDEKQGTWTQSGSNITFLESGESLGETITGKISGNVLTISATGTEGGDTYNLTMRCTKI